MQTSRNLNPDGDCEWSTLPKGNYFLADQLNRAALSIPLTIAEGHGRWHANDRKQFFIIARGSVHECVPILEMCSAKQLLTIENQKKLLAGLEEISKMISGLIKGTSEKRSA